MLKPILDMTAGSRMFWWDKQNENVTFVDKRDVEYELPDRMIKVHPDIVADWTKKLPFSDNKFHMVVFDPPHLLHAGDSSWLKKKYWVLNKDTWQDDLKHGFPEPYNEKYIPSRAKVFPDKKLLQIETDSWDFHNDEDCIDTVTVPINHCPKCGRKL